MCNVRRASSAESGRDESVCRSLRIKMIVER